MQRIQKLFLSLASAFSLAVFLVSPAKAADLECGALSNVGGVNLCKLDTLQGVIDVISNWLVGLLGGVLALVILYSAIEIISSAGNPDRLKTAKDRMVQAAISLGLLIGFRVIIGIFGIT